MAAKRHHDGCTDFDGHRPTTTGVHVINITTTRFDEDYAPSESSRATTNFANLARGVHRQQNLRNALTMIDRRFNDLADWDNPNGDRYTLELEIISVAASIHRRRRGSGVPADRGARDPNRRPVDRRTSPGDRRATTSRPTCATTTSACGCLRQGSLRRLRIPADFGDLHGKLFQHFVDSVAYRERFAHSPVICISVSTSKTYRRTANLPSGARRRVPGRTAPR